MSAAFAPYNARAVTDSPTLSTSPLRILVVDDNHVNLAVLSTLLKRRFSHLLACPPVALDSGLKAIQALRNEVFDIIFMDIEMPYLDGVECTRRIRAGEDGILQANRDTHIVAVTTNVGDVPGVLYRQVGMNGMISKPVRFEHFRQYLYPLSAEACHSQRSVVPLTIGRASVMPPMPPVHLDARKFFVPLTTTAPAQPPPAAVLSQGSGEFAAMLKAQTTKSLSDRKAVSMARAGTFSLPRRSSFSSPRSEHLASIRPTIQTAPAQPDSFETLVDLEVDSQDRLSRARRSPFLYRPAPVHRLSSPAYMLDSSPSYSTRRESHGNQRPILSGNGEQYKRPSIRPLEGRSHPDSNDFDTRASSSSTWSNTQSSGMTTDSDTRNPSPSSTATTPLSSPSECGLDWQDMFSKVVFSPCADDMALPHTKTPWDQQDALPASRSGRQSPSVPLLFEPPTRPLTAPSA